MHLTYPNQDAYSEAVSTAKAEGAGAPETKIEITPEMIEAGCEQMDALAHPALEPTPKERRLAVIEIFRAMIAAQPKSPSGDQQPFV
jgi:hypothetical protein